MRKPLIANIDIAGPFKILAQQVWLKDENRKPPVTGEAIAPTAVQASSSDTGSAAANLINGKGLRRNLSREGLVEHSSDASSMWRSTKGDAKAWVEFEFDKPQTLGSICIWNYNDTWYTNRGVQKMDVSVWTQETGWRKIREGQPVDQAEGGDSYDEPMFLHFDTVTAQKVRFDNLVSPGDAEHVGLSKVQFFGPRGAQAVRPSPSHEAAGVGLSNLVLSWVPGDGAVAHNVYFGTDAANLSLLGKVTGTEAGLSRLVDRTKYYWRVDEVRSDGSVAKGATWSFNTSGLIAWWKLDEAEGRNVPDASAGGNAGTLEGDPKWQPAGGRVGGALEFDGNRDFVRIGNKTPFDVTDEVSVAAWIKVRAFDKTWQTVIAKGDYSWRLARDRDRTAMQFGAGRYADNRVVRGNVNVNDGKWHHVVGVGNADRVSLYVDGVLDQTATVRGKMQIDDTPVSIGENSDATCRGRYWNGWIDEVCIFTYALSGDDIKAFYSGKEPTALAGSTSASSLPTLVSQR